MQRLFGLVIPVQANHCRRYSHRQCYLELTQACHIESESGFHHRRRNMTGKQRLGRVVELDLRPDTTERYRKCITNLRCASLHICLVDHIAGRAESFDNLACWHATERQLTRIVASGGTRPDAVVEHVEVWMRHLQPVRREWIRLCGRTVVRGVIRVHPGNPIGLVLTKLRCVVS